MFLFTLLLTLPLTVFASNLNISASVDKNVVALGEAIQLQVVVSGDVTNIPHPQPPELNDFEVRSSGRSQNISIVNGRVSSSTSFNYTLFPKRVGKFRIGSFTINYKGQLLSTTPIDIEVKQEKSTLDEPQTHQIKKAQDVFVEAFTDKKSAYVGEQITLTFRFYSSVQLLSQPHYTPPAISGFVTEELPPHRNYRTTIAGREYQVTEIKTALFPVSKGTLTIGPAAVVVTIPSVDDFFDEFFFRGFFSTGKQVELKSRPIVISVKDLPEEGKPVKFSGAVGSYKISASLDKSNLEVGQAATLKVKISGTGNIKSIPQPEISIPNFRQYETISSVNVTRDGQLIGGSKEFKTVIIPTKPGGQVIQPISFSFFEPQSGSYRTVFSNPISVEIRPGKLPSTPTPSVQKEPSQPIKYVAEDIRHIKQTLSGSSKLKVTHTWLFSQLLPLCLFTILVYIDKSRQKLLSNKELLRRTSAYRVAIKSLKKTARVKTSLADGIQKLSNILKNYIADKYNLSRYGITNEQILETLKSANIDEDLISSVEKFLTKSDYIKYAPVQKGSEDFQSDIKEVKELIARLERIIK